MENRYEKQSQEFCAAIKKLASNDDNLSNFESYLSLHFEKWMRLYANTPDAITSELREFADMEIL